MIRYIRQNDNFRCGPIAILNFQKWLGDKVSYNKNIDNLTTMCKSWPNGTKDVDLVKTIRRVCKNRVVVKESKYINTLSSIEKHINRNGAIVLAHRAWDEPDEDHLHFSLLVPDDEYFGYVTWINSFAYDHPHTKWVLTPTAISVTFHKFEKLLMSKQRIGDKISGIMITKNE